MALTKISGEVVQTPLAEKLSIPYPTLQDRIRRGWDIERAFTP